jgi:prevent-host-death family protein
MHQENIHSAKTNLLQLIERVMAGEDVIIANAGKPLVRMVAVDQESKKGKRMPGLLKGKMRLADDWDSKQTNDEVTRLMLAQGEVDDTLVAR